MCDECREWKFDCHGYGERILCPECAQRTGHKLWCLTRKGGNMEETIVTNVIEEEQFFENGNKAVTQKKVDGKIRLSFFENGEMKLTKEFTSNAGAYKSRKKWLGA